MTNKEAAEILQGMLEGLEGGEYIHELKLIMEALNIAIKALEKTDGDLISRTDLLKELEKWDWQELYLPIHFKELVDELPSADNTAEWHIVGKTTLHYECSKCGGAGDEWDKFCKHCGARMGVKE